MRIAISSESSCDLPQELIDENGIKIIPYHLTVGDESFTDGELSTDKLIELAEAKKTLPKTAAINEYEFTEYFGRLRAEYDAVVHISLSSELTCATANAQRAAAKLSEVYVVDSRTLSSGIGLLVLYACDLAKEGYKPDKIAKMVAQKTPYVQCSSMIEKLDYLYKGGRCNSLVYFGANLLKIRPRIIIRKGKIGHDRRYRGNIVRALERYCHDILTDFPPDKDICFVVYTTATPEMIETGRAAAQAAGFKRIYESQARGTVTSHCGSHVLGLMYFTKKPDDGAKLK